MIQLIGGAFRLLLERKKVYLMEILSGAAALFCVFVVVVLAACAFAFGGKVAGAIIAVLLAIPVYFLFMLIAVFSMYWVLAFFVPEREVSPVDAALAVKARWKNALLMFLFAVAIGVAGQVSGQIGAGFANLGTARGAAVLIAVSVVFGLINWVFIIAANIFLTFGYIETMRSGANEPFVSLLKKSWDDFLRGWPQMLAFFLLTWVAYAGIFVLFLTIFGGAAVFFWSAVHSAAGAVTIGVFGILMFIVLLFLLLPLNSAFAVLLTRRLNSPEVPAGAAVAGQEEKI